MRNRKEGALASFDRCLPKWSRPSCRLEKTRDRRLRSARDLAMLSGPSSAVPPPHPILFPSPCGRRAARQDLWSFLACSLSSTTTGDPATEYLSDGITETIINTLSRLERLRVMASSTVFRYKGTAIDRWESAGGWVYGPSSPAGWWASATCW